LVQFFENRTGHISQLANSAMPTDEDIHDARKKIKDILYTSKIAGKQMKVDAPVKELDALSDLIGDYNDERTIISHLKEFPAKNMDHAEKSNLKHLKDRETKRLRRKKEAVLEATKKYTEVLKDSR